MRPDSGEPLHEEEMGEGRAAQPEPCEDRQIADLQVQRRGAEERGERGGRDGVLARGQQHRRDARGEAAVDQREHREGEAGGQAPGGAPRQRVRGVERRGDEGEAGEDGKGRADVPRSGSGALASVA